MTTNKKILIAVDSFKGSLSSLEAANAIERGLLVSNDNLNIKKFPLADGGEGTVESVIEGLGGEYVKLNAQDPLRRKVGTYYSG